MSDKECTVCKAQFRVRFAYQVQRTLSETSFFCSHECQKRHLMAESRPACSVCGTLFEPLYAFQQRTHDGVTTYFCKEECRRTALAQEDARRRSVKKIAVLNQKGGTGKTTTSISLAAGLADLGRRVLLVDLDAQSNVAVSLGLTAPRSISDVLLGEAHALDCVVQVSPNLDAIISGASLSTVETKLVQLEVARHEVLSARLAAVKQYDFVILDCSPSLSVLNQNSLTYADYVLIPVSCDYLSLVGVRNIMRTLKSVNEVLLSPVEILGVVPTFYGLSEQCTRETMKSLKGFFGDKVLHEIRVDPTLRQAPMHRKTIFEHAPNSMGAQDYRALAAQVAARAHPAQSPPRPPSPPSPPRRD